MRRIIYILAVAALTTIYSCSPRLEKSTITLPESYLYGGGMDTTSLDNPVWWEIMGDTTLNKLITSALAKNRSFAATMALVEAAQYNTAIARSEYMPSLQIGAEGSREYEEVTTTDLFDVELAASWQLPLFGAYKAKVEEARASIASTEWGYRAAYLSLAAEVATAYYSLLMYSSNLKSAEDSYKLRSEATTLIDSMYKYGMKNDIELSQARALVYSAEQDIYSYKRAIKLTKLSLALLLGESPESYDSDWIVHCISDVKLPPTIPIGVPSDILHSRPDVMQSYYDMAQAAAEVKGARASRYPSLSITSSGGVLSSTVKGLTSSEPWAWGVVASLAQPLFSFGALSKSEKAAKKRYIASLNNYEESILTALSDVESALVSIQNYNKEIDIAANLARINKKIAKASNELYINGMYDYLNVVDSEREYYSSQIAYIENLTTQYINYVKLFTSIGGGW